MQRTENGRAAEQGPVHEQLSTHASECVRWSRGLASRARRLLEPTASALGPCIGRPLIRSVPMLGLIGSRGSLVSSRPGPSKAAFFSF